MLLSELIKGAPDIDIKQLSSDSRVPMKDAIFFCVQGFKFDGHEFIEEAINNGAKVIIYEKELKGTDGSEIYIENDAAIYPNGPLNLKDDSIISGSIVVSKISAISISPLLKVC